MKRGLAGILGAERYGERCLVLEMERRRKVEKWKDREEKGRKTVEKRMESGGA